uniref:Slc29a-1 n=1 Tax=Schmidtea mediterranea TaxID=79327 RepID=A0A0H3YJF9_SCHMD|nr:slc29a-1 [Schmidtea mediterranea]
MLVNANEDDLLLKDTKNVKDKYHLVYFIVFFTGIGVLIPWNFFITAKQYFVFKLTDTGNSTASDLPYKFENYLSIASMVPAAIINILNLVLRRYITPMRRFSVGISLMFLVFLVTLILTKVNTQKDIMSFFIITMISVVILNTCSGIMQGSSLGVISMMPGRYIKGYMEGQAIGGLIASVANILAIVAVSSPDSSAFIYFLVALIFLLITGIGFCRLGKIKFSRSYVKIANQMDNETEDEYPDIAFNTDSLPLSSIGNRQSFMEKYAPLVKQIYWFGLTVTLEFVVTLSLFPAFSSQIVTQSNNENWKKFFTPVTCFLFFNIADYIGRYFCGILKFPSQNYPKTLFFIALIRFIFVPLIFMCNIPTRTNFPIIFYNDAYPIVFTILLGLTNGYFITLSLIYAPSQVSDKEKEAVGTLMNLFLCFGLAFGVALSFVYLYII